MQKVVSLSATETSIAGSKAPLRSLKERQREERGALILQAAQELLMEKGYHETSIEEIAMRVGVSKGAVYLHFPSKEALVETLLAQQVTMFLTALQRISAEDATVYERLKQILEWSYSQLRERRVQLLLELNNSLGLSRRMLAQRTEFCANVAQASELIASLFEEGKRNGELTPSAPTPLLVATYLSLMSPDGYRQLLTDGQISPAELAEQVTRLLFDGIRSYSTRS